MIVGDRLYSSYALFASLLEQQNTDFLIRVKQERGVMKCLADLPMRELDRQVNFTITTTQTKEDKEQGYIFLQTQKMQIELTAQTHALDDGNSLLHTL